MHIDNSLVGRLPPSPLEKDSLDGSLTECADDIPQRQKPTVYLDGLLKTNANRTRALSSFTSSKVDLQGQNEIF